LTCKDFLDMCLCLDIETSGSEIVYHLGAVRGDVVFERKGRFDLQSSLKELDDLARPAQYILGHNILGHDLPILESQAPHLELLNKPVIDTLYLSPLAFPENPYHRLVKDYKLVRDSINDPVADARLSASVFCDQWNSFAALQGNEKDIISFYHYCFSDSKGSSFRCEGLTEVFAALGAESISENEAFQIFEGQTQGKACENAIAMVSLKYLLDPEKRPALAYCLAWLRVAGNNSVLPPWVRHRFSDIVPILRELRDIPCTNPSCRYCQTTHNPRFQLGRLRGRSFLFD